MTDRERHVLERAVRSIAEQAVNTNKVIEEAMDAAKQVRLELLKVKADLERELGIWVLDCKACGMDVHWVQGISMADPGHWGHRLPSPHGEPVV
jgi:hypothetical protein